MRTLPRGYPHEPRTLGEHLRRRRLDLGLRQRDLAERWGVRETTLAAWETGRSQPFNRHRARIIEFLGGDPMPVGDSVAARLEAARRRLGQTHREFAARIGLAEGSIRRWLKNAREPSRAMADRLEALLAELEGGKSHAGSAPVSAVELTRWKRSWPNGVEPASPGERLRARRLAAGFTQEEAARELGVHVATVRRWEANVADRTCLQKTEARRAALPSARTKAATR